MSAGALADEVRGRLGSPPGLADPPLVSIVVVTRDGLEHLRTLLTGLVAHTDYPRLELIVVDNGSEDGTVDFLCEAVAPFPIVPVANQHNESFSDANNRGAAAARGELLLFLNNDVEPFEWGWLRELVACLRASRAGAAGATLVFPHDDRERFRHGYAVQHRGLRFRDEGGAIGPALHDWEADPLDWGLGDDVESPVVVAACLLVEVATFAEVGGFTRGYVYGYEDIDFSFKLRAAGMPVVCSGRSVLIHRPGSTRRTLAFERARTRKLRNHRLLLERWGPRLRREHDLDALAGGGMWVQSGREDGAAPSTRREAESLRVCLRSTDRLGEEPDPLEGLCRAAAARGHTCLILRGQEVKDLRGLEFDLAIHLRGSKRYLPVPGQFNVLWAVEPRHQLTGQECDLYDLVLSRDGEQADRLRAGSATPVVAVDGAVDGVLDAALAAVEASDRPTRIDRATTIAAGAADSSAAA